MKVNHLWRALLGRRRSIVHGVHKQPGQALVELALSLTLLVMLLGAAVDLGLAYKTHQTLTNAAAEASTFLSLQPLYPSSSGTLTPAAADNEARNRFRYEQGDTMRRFASTLDLDADGNIDSASVVTARVQIDVTDSDQIINAGGNFAANIIGSLVPISGGSQCAQRSRFDPANPDRQCFIVVRAEMTYKPFFIKPFVGNEMTIRVVSVKPIVGGP